MHILGHDIKGSQSRRSEKHGIQGKIPDSGCKRIQDGRARAEVTVDARSGREELRFFHTGF